MKISKQNKALEQNDRALAQAELKKIGLFYQNNSNFKGIKVHMHDSKLNSFVRSWSEKSGDALRSRNSLQILKEKQKALVSYELTDLGYMIHAIAPIVKEGNYLGSIEFLQGVGSVSRDFLKEDSRMILLLNTGSQEKIAKLQTNKHVGKYVLANNK